MNGNALSYDFKNQRLALGVEFEDYLRGEPLAFPVRVEIERGLPHPSPLSKHFYAFKQLGTKAPYGLLRHATGRYSLSYYAGIKDSIDLRTYDHERIYVPRRLRVPLRTLAEVMTIEENEVSDYFLGRVREVVLFPGASYHNHSLATGLRGRVLRNGEVMRWAYVEARDLITNSIVSRARGDDRGEFLLVLPPHAVPGSDLTASIDVRVSVAGPAIEPVPGSADLPALDSYWDLPLEQLPIIGAVDNVANGESFPIGFVTALSSVRTVNFIAGQMLTGREVSDFDFFLP